jgi:hypothetical protein
MKNQNLLANERGTMAILISVMILGLLTIISIAASRTANTEIKIAANEYVHQSCFYNAEGAVLEVVDWLENDADALGAPPAWLSLEEDIVNDSNVFRYWEGEKNGEDAVPQASAIDPQNTEYLSIHHGIPSGNSLDMSKPAIHGFSIYGRCKNKGVVMLKIGYAKVYE